MRLLPNGNFPFQTAPPDKTFRAGFSALETLAAQRQLAWILAGDYRNPRRIESGISTRFNPLRTHFRSPDVVFRGGYSELKFAGDRINHEEVRMDTCLQNKGYRVRYDIVPHPLSGMVTPSRDLARLKFSGVSYKKWNPQFWRLGRGMGLRLPLTWDSGALGSSRAPC